MKTTGKEFDFKTSIRTVKEYLKQRPTPVSKALIPGNIIIYKYNAKDKTQIYDKTPLVMILSVSRSYMLGLNLHWCPYPMRKILVNFFLKINKSNIKSGKPLELSYSKVKPMLFKLGFYPVIRLYIRKRMSGSVILIPHTEILNVIKIKSETFTSGKTVRPKSRKSRNK